MKFFLRLWATAVETFYGLKHFDKDDYFVVSIGDYVIVPTHYDQASEAFEVVDAMNHASHLDIPMNLEALRDYSLFQHAARLEHFSRFLSMTSGYKDHPNSKRSVELKQSILAEAENLNEVTKVALNKRLQILDNNKPLALIRVPMMNSDIGYSVEVNDKVFPSLTSNDLDSVRLPHTGYKFEFNKGTVIRVFWFQPENKKLDRRLHGLHKLLNRLVSGVHVNSDLIRFVSEYISSRVEGYQTAIVAHRRGEGHHQLKFKKYLRDYDLHVNNVFASKETSEDEDNQAWAMTQSVLDKVSKKTS